MSASAATSGTGSRATAHMTIAGGPAYADATTPVIDPDVFCAINDALNANSVATLSDTTATSSLILDIQMSS